MAAQLIKNVLPQIRLRSIFLFLFCAAIGMTGARNFIGWLEPAADVAIGIGLLQQVWQLRTVRSTQFKLTNQILIARAYAIFWRIAILLSVVGLQVWEFLVARQVVVASERSFVFVDPLTDGLPQLCVLIVLCNSYLRWRPERTKTSW